ncbi:hypothetical protein B0J14DRAFT_562704 [Halenospora varia]|nr:hypothetical protein B0J14DRAFT_562704 [Halenospora varia]
MTLWKFWSTPPFLLSQRTQRCGVCIFPLRWTSDWLVPLWSGLVHAGICQGQEQIIGALESFPPAEKPCRKQHIIPNRTNENRPPNYEPNPAELHKWGIRVVTRQSQLNSFGVPNPALNMSLKITALWQFGGDA